MSQTWTPFYVPLTPPHDQHVGLISYDPHNLPLCSNDTYRTQLMNIKNAHSVGSQTQCEKDYGINRECILTELPLISISRSFPHDWMHLCLENHGKNLVSFWKGMYKGMDKGRKEYWILDHVWTHSGKYSLVKYCYQNTMQQLVKNPLSLGILPCQKW